MNIIITGHEGYLGKLLLPELEGLMQRHAISDMPLGKVRGFSIPYRDPTAWTDALETVFAWTPLDLVIHAATERLPRHEQCEPDAERRWAANYQCAKQIADLTRQKGAKLIFTSTCSSIEPTTMYGWAKRASCDYIKAVVKNYCILNIYTIFGKEDTSNNKESPIRKLMENKLPYTFHPCFRDYIHVEDVVRAILYVIENEIAGEYDLGTGVGVSTQELVKIWRKTNPRVLPPGQWPLGVPQRLVARSHTMLPGFTTKIDVREWLRTQLINDSILEQDLERTVSYPQNT